MQRVVVEFVEDELPASGPRLLTCRRRIGGIADIVSEYSDGKRGGLDFHHEEEEGGDEEG